MKTGAFGFSQTSLAGHREGGFVFNEVEGHSKHIEEDRMYFHGTACVCERSVSANGPRHVAAQPPISWGEMENQSQVLQAVHELQDLLPQNKDAAILDIGFGSGWFLAACLKLGYRELSGAEFGIVHKDYIRTWSERPIQLYEIEDNIGNFLADRAEQYEFIHLSHVIEHIPKYSLLWVVDALYRALKPGGVLMLRTPNMEGPCANSSLYVTLAHEYGFCGSNLESLLDICGFGDVRFHRPITYRPTLKQKAGH
jgi:2-polyprenyl-3-methyl-5-hydroxy-6-metoxy-1,4-benzoquinol methylase